MKLRRRPQTETVPASTMRALQQRAVPAPPPAHRAKAHQAWEIGVRHRRWLVMWSAYHRTFTAFACFAPQPLVIDATTAEALEEQLYRMESYYADHPIVSVRWPAQW